MRSIAERLPGRGGGGTGFPVCAGKVSQPSMGRGAYIKSSVVDPKLFLMWIRIQLPRYSGSGQVEKSQISSILYTVPNRTAVGL
jgi:hypothetical protein